MSKPLTIEELKAMQVGDWVWVVKDKQDGRYYTIVENNNAYIFVQCFGGWITFEYSDYGIKWTAYKNKEQAEGALL